MIIAKSMTDGSYTPASHCSVVDKPIGAFGLIHKLHVRGKPHLLYMYPP